MKQNFEAGKSYKVTNGIYVGSVVTAIRSTTPTSLTWQCQDATTRRLLYLHPHDVEPLVEVVPPTVAPPEPMYVQQVGRGVRVAEEQLPKLMDLLPQERQRLIGELIDAMVYSGIAVADLQAAVVRYRRAGYIKSEFFPQPIKCDE